MSSDHESKRKRSTALRKRTKARDPDLLTTPNADASLESQRQMTLSVPNSKLTLSEPLQPFFEACGGVQTIELTAGRQDSPASSERRLFRQPFFVIGRASGCDLVIPDPTASFRHIYVQLISGRWFFLNLAKISSSSAGMGQPESGWLDVDSQLKVGSYVITRVAIGQPALIRNVAVSNSEPSFDASGFELEVMNRVHGSQKPPSIRFCNPVTLIGGSRKCDLFLKDESVSKVHASLVLTPYGVWVVDLLGRGGVSVDGRPVLWKHIHDGAILQIGRFRLRVRCDSSRKMPTRRNETRVVPMNVPVPAAVSVQGGSMSEAGVLSLIGQLADMQHHFFEQSRLQAQWMSEMISHVGRAQQESARRDIARIEEIGKELREIRSQLAGAANSVPSNPTSNLSTDRAQPMVEATGTPDEETQPFAGTTSPKPDVVEPVVAATVCQAPQLQPMLKPMSGRNHESLPVQISATVPARLQERNRERLSDPS